MDKALNRNYFFQIVFTLFFALTISKNAYADLPFITEDAKVVGCNAWQVYLFSFMEKTHPKLQIFVPATEINYGLTDAIELTTFLGWLSVNPREGKNAYGFSDVWLQVKYILLNQTETLPMISILPIYSLPSGEVDKGTGNGRSFWYWPIVFEKTWDKWDWYLELGYTSNGQPGQHNFLFGGMVTEYAVTDKFSIGAEIYSQGARSVTEKSFTLLNLGTTYNLSKELGLLFSAGHTFLGEEHFISFAGIVLNFS